MSIFSFFNKTDKTGRDSTINSEEVLAGSESEGKDEVTTSLVMPEQWNISKEQEYVLKFHSNDLKPLKSNQLSLAGITIDEDKVSGDWIVQAFVRSSLNQEVKLGKMELILMDADNAAITSKEFDLGELGVLPPKSNKPWIFTFEKKLVDGKTFPGDDWLLAFNVQSIFPHAIDLDESWEKALPETQKNALEELVKTLPKLKPSEVNITGFQASFRDDGNLVVSLFIRNGHTKHIQLEKLPLEVLDAKGTRVVKGTFELDQLLVKANTSKPWTFIFPAQTLANPQPDLSKWAVRIPQQNQQVNE
ncbi:accessory Sec system S-layer assembly protein [Planomicrobium sp. YIM 101495]|uniref:accessory Sec system S-layer assembly protein n=1 Tax=Planomicrobium sp. YIM 101495 TaxID=2665160 RepID=UPI0012B77F06|nr:accessory Sec system S-layer assembly protein [Planomicrobium sp. YIM 101495]MTD30502.1 accessory Sec system S-layer assembly protein [Planomicrobium sp. YIM 101495]